MSSCNNLFLRQETIESYQLSLDMQLFSIVCAISVPVGHSLAVYNESVETNLAVYWGQNSVKSLNETAQKPMYHYCQKSEVDIVILAFVVAMNNEQNNPEINLTNA